MFRRLIEIILLGSALWPSTNVLGQSGEPYRVLFLGNSRYVASGGPLQPFEGFCQAGGLDFEAVSQRGGEGDPVPLRPSAHGIDFAGLGRIDPFIRNVAKDERVRALISSGEFDYVIIHSRQTDFLPDWIDTSASDQASVRKATKEAFKDLHQLIVESGGTTVVTMNHASSNNFHWMHIVAEAHRRLKEELDSMVIGGSRHPIVLVPTGLFWLDGKERLGLEAWYRDPGHATELGQYATGALFYTYLTGEDPRQNDFVEYPASWEAPDVTPRKSVPADQAEWIKNLAWWYYRHFQ